MFSLSRKSPEPTSLDEAIDNLVSKLPEHDEESEDHTAVCQSIKTLCEANAIAHATAKPDTVSLETVAMIAGNLTGIVMILSYEHVNVITSKALGFVMKTKV